MKNYVFVFVLGLFTRDLIEYTTKSYLEYTLINKM